MKILFNTDIDIEYEDHPVLDEALRIAEGAGIQITYVIEGFYHVAKKRLHPVAVVNHIDEGRMKRTWEQYFDTCIITFPDRVEMRYYEPMSEDGSKYMTHTEKFFPMSRNLDTELFLSGFFRALAVDPVDLRKAVRLGVKLRGSHEDASVVG